MKIERAFAIASSVLLFSLSDAGDLAAHEKLSKSVCANPKPETLCDSGNTCGSKTVPCAVDVKRTSSSTSATAAVPNSKGNQVFCVAVGTPVKWYSTSKKTGFLVDFGSASPFAEETVIGGSDREVSTVTKKPGCYKYSVGACYSGGLSGMCESAEAEVIATGGK